MRSRLGGILLAGLALLLPASGASQIVGNSGEGELHAPPVLDPEAMPRPSSRAVRISTPIVLDGILDEAAWEEAEVITGFIQSMPDAGAPATEQTVVRVVYDDKRLYVGALMLDSEPQGIIHQFLEQDFETHDDDVFAVTLDTFLDRRDSFMFLINPNGAVKDGQTFDNSRTTNLAWEGVIEVETTIHQEGWTVELAIPFTTLRFDPSRDEQAWGMNFLRRIRRKNEDSYWAPVDRRTRVHTMAYAGTVSGFSDLPRPRNVTVKPFGLVSNSSGSLLDPTDEGGSGDFGMDLKWGVTPRLTLDLTYRTDFSQVEVDREQVNLTRFSLFFPEKRDFFMENAGIFSFGDFTERNVRQGASPRDFTLFHSRRIGLAAGRPVPIVAGGRVTGRAGGFDVGVLNMRTESAEGLPAESFSVARVRRNLGGVQIGGLFASRDPLESGQGESNRSFGADVNITLAGNLLIQSYLAATDYPGVTGNNRASRISAAFRDRLWDVSALYREIGDAFEPGVGFVSRRGIRHSYGTVGAHPRPPIPHVNEINPYLEMHYITDLQGSLETREGAAGLSILFSDGSELGATATDRFEAIDEAFTVASGKGEVGPGDYAFREGSLKYTSNAARPLSGEVQLSGGGFYDGDRRSLTLSGAWRPSRYFAVDLQVQRNQITLPDEAFTADVFGVRLDVAGSRRLFLSSFFQYNAASEEAVTNVRLNYIHAPLSDVFLVFSERRNADSGGILERGLTLKVTKLFSF